MSRFIKDISRRTQISTNINEYQIKNFKEISRRSKYQESSGLYLEGGKYQEISRFIKDISRRRQIPRNIRNHQGYQETSRDFKKLQEISRNIKNYQGYI